MNKLKNIGISALAGTLVSLSAAQAGGVSVNGTWELSYTNLNHEKVTGNKFGINKNITFGAGGDISDGGAVTWATSIATTDAMGLSSASMNINMGGIATLAFDHGTGGYGVNAVDNIVPTAWEEVDYGLSTGITDLGAVSASKGVVNLTIKAPNAGTGISISYVGNVGGGHIADGATSGETTGGKGLDLVVDFIDYNSKYFGMRFGMAGEVELKDITCKGLESDSAGTSTTACMIGHKDNPYGASSFATLKLGPLSMGTQATFKDPMDPTVAGIKNKRSIVAGAALMFGDTISVSYGKAWDKYRYNDSGRGHVYQDDHSGGGVGDNDLEGPGEYEMIKYQGWSAAMNIGPLAIKGTKNNVDGAGEGGSNEARSHSELNLSLAF
jgi:hypothetical protein